MIQACSTVEINVPVGTAYNQWTQFGDFHHFMTGVKEVRQLDASRLLWMAKVDGVPKEWFVRIMRQVPDRLVAWTSESGSDSGGTAIFNALGDHRSEIKLHVEYRPDEFDAAPGDNLSNANEQVADDLVRFKDFLEGRGFESGAWRGEIMHGHERLAAPLLDSADIPDHDQIRFGV